MTNAGYSFVAPSTWGENIGYRAQRPSTPDPFTTAGQLHADLFIDAGIDGRGHRTNMMNPAFKEIGAGIVSGDFNAYNAVMLTTDFAASGTGSFITGVAFNDTTTADNFYTPGEGISNVTITATRIGSGEVYTTTTFPTGAGGYSVKVPEGKYVLSATGGTLPATLRHGNVVISSQNVKVDVRHAQAGTIRGSVWNDANGNGVQDAGEQRIPNLLIYLDSHKDGRRNRAEMYARTNVDGAYKFTNLLPGTYRVRQTPIDGMILTTPTSGYFDVTLAAGATVGGRSFGNVASPGIMARRITPGVPSTRQQSGIDHTGDERQDLLV
jgi:hypothetical protein